MKHLIAKIGTIATDTVTDVTGQVTHAYFGITGSQQTHLQPKGINPETGQSVDGIWAATRMLKGAELVEVELPSEVVGSIVTDTSTGVKGTAIGLTLHENGCVHIEVQPKGTQPKTGGALKPSNIDIRKLSGSRVPKMAAVEKEESKTKTPSPSPTSAIHLRG